MTQATQKKEPVKQENKVPGYKPKYFCIGPKRRLALLIVSRSQGETNKIQLDCATNKVELTEFTLNVNEHERLRRFSGDICLEDILDEYQRKTFEAR